MLVTTILKFVCLAFAIAYTFANVVEALRFHYIDSAPLLIMGGAWAGFIVLQWLI